METETAHLKADERSQSQREVRLIGLNANQNEEISLLNLLIVLVEQKRVFYRITGAFFLIALVVSLLLPNRYTATVTLLPPQQNSSMAAALTSQLSSLGSMAALAGGSLGLKNPNELFIGMLKSRTVEDAMVERYGLMREYRERYISDARKTFEKRVSVDGSGKDGLIRISVEDHDPSRAAELANGYVDQFRSLSEHLAITEASQRRLFFEKQLEQAKDNLANAEEVMKQTQQTTGLIQFDSQARALIESATSLRAQIAAKEVQIEGMQTFATNQNAQLIQSQRELESLRTQLAKLGGSESGGTGGFIVPKGKVPEAGLEYGRKLREVKYRETIFEILARQFEIAKLDEAKQGSLIQVVDSAIVPDKKSYPKRTLIVIGATLAGFLVSVLVALFRATFLRLKEDVAISMKLDRLRRGLSLRTHRP